MTRVEFFFNVDDKLHKVAELGEKIMHKGRRLLVYAPDSDVAQRLEHHLWMQPAIGFLPHCRADSNLAGETPIIIDWRSEVLPHDDVLINLQSELPSFFSRFRRLIEIVGQDEADKVEARVRYRFYRDRGYEVRSFDASGASL